MERVSLACVIAYCLTASFVGVRLCRLALRTGEAPERYIGLALLVGGAIGYPMLIAASLAVDTPAVSLRFGVAGAIGLHAATFANLLVWRLVFHGSDPRALVATTAISGLLLLSLVEQVAMVVARLAPAQLPLGVVSTPAQIASSVVQATPYLLLAVSSFRYADQLRRRLALGLADPIVRNRIQLWGSVGVVVVLQYTIGVASALRSGAGGVGSTASTLGVALLGLVLAVLLGLAFFPPPSYERWIRARAEALHPQEA